MILDAGSRAVPVVSGSSWKEIHEQFSVIEQDLHRTGEGVLQAGLAMRSQLHRFIQSASLHGVRPVDEIPAQRSLPPLRRAMTLAEGHALVSRLAVAWRTHRRRGQQAAA